LPKYTITVKMPLKIANSSPQKINYDLKLLGSLITPSALSGMICILISLFAVGGVVALTNYQGSSFQQDVQRFQNHASRENLENDFVDINSDFEQNILIDRAPVMVFWMFVGALVYLILSGIIGAVSSANQLEEEMHYIHAKRNELIKLVLTKSAIRLVVLAAWFGFILLFFKILLPYCLAASRVGGSN